MEGNEKKLSALRGATCCRNNADDLSERVTALYDELLARNGLREQDLVSLIFSVTRDLDADNPAAALRHAGRAADLALFSVQEAAVAGGLERVVRVLMHCYLGENVTPVHVYQNGAEILRPDRVKA
ncbi:MAG: chorismate mutase [Treponema sp.]|jgi:chorismate mutase|nr:chorismate mutase [Treponema sp.]